MNMRDIRINSDVLLRIIFVWTHLWYEQGKFNLIFVSYALYVSVPMDLTCVI